MAVSIADIKKLREMTQAGMTDCKNALIEANNNIEEAVLILRKKGQAKADKRGDREASEGRAIAKTDGKFACALSLKCETDFVGNNEGFKALANKILEAAFAAKAKTIDEVNALTIDGRVVADLVKEQSGTTGEKMEIGAYATVEGEGAVAYNHFNGKLATIVAFNEPVEEAIASEVAQQVAAMNPVSVSREDVPADVRDREFRLGRDKALEEGKPEAIVDRIAEGRLAKFYKESCLMEQELISDNKISVADYLKKSSKTLKAISFARINLNAD